MWGLDIIYWDFDSVEPEKKVEDKETSLEESKENETPDEENNETKSDEVKEHEDSENQEEENNEVKSEDGETETDEWSESDTESKDEILDSIDELDKLLWELDDINNNESNDKTELDEDIQENINIWKALKEIKRLKKEVTNLTLEKAESEKFWSDANLSSWVIIMKKYYDDAMNWDEDAKAKVLELVKRDLWVDLQPTKDIIFSNSIQWDSSTNAKANMDDWFDWVTIG